VNNLRNGGGLNGTTKLDDPSLIADSAIDDLKGNNDSDLFFANTIGGSAFKDKLSDRKPDEVVFQLG
jgi:hypothetical protein